MRANQIKWDKGNSAKILSTLIVASLVIGAMPLVFSMPVQNEPTTVIAAKTLTRTEPVVCLGSQFPAYVSALRDVDNLFVWA